MYEKIHPLVKKYLNWYLNQFEDESECMDIEFESYDLEKSVLKTCILEGMRKAGDIEQLHTGGPEIDDWTSIIWRPRPRVLPKINAEIRKAVTPATLASFEEQKRLMKKFWRQEKI